MNRLKELRKEHNMSQEELGALLGVQKAAVCKYEVGRVPLPHDVLVKLCDHFDVSADYLLGRESSGRESSGRESSGRESSGRESSGRESSGRESSGMVTPLFKQRAELPKSLRPIANVVGVPLVGRVHAGLPMLADENISEYIPLPLSDVTSGECFYMEVEGDCMTGEFIPEGALVLVRLQPSVENGQIAVIRLGEEVLLRKVKLMGEALMLIPANTRYEPMLVNRAAAEIIGRVVEVRIRNI